MTRGLTGLQSQTLKYISTYQTRHSYPPSLQEIASHLGVKSRSTAYEHVKALKRKGFLQNTAGRARTLVIVPR